MRNLFRRFSVFACTLFWNNGTGICNPVHFVRKYWAQLVLSSITIQTIACAYGGEDVSYGDSSTECRPAFIVDKFTNEGYTECEKQIVEQAKKLLMKQQGITEPEAHRAMQQYAMNHGIKMIEYAEQVLNKGIRE